LKNPVPAIFPDKVRCYRLLTQRWQRLVKRNSFLRLRTYYEEGGYSLFVVESVGAPTKAPSLYISTGIHGDEPAGVEALIRWGEESLSEMKGWNLQIFPCLNPWGIERNIRFDAQGRDLNRCYNKRSVPQIAAQRVAMKGTQFDLALMLHEDYDARGFYLYEIAGIRPFWGELLRDALAPTMPPDLRRDIDGHRANKGVIRRKVHPEMLKGHPEAFRLHFHHAKRTLTFESPSEDLLVRRVEIHQSFIRFATNLLSPPLSEVS